MYPCTHPSWLKLWYAHYIDDVEPLLITILDKNDCVRAIAPMMRLRKSYEGHHAGTVMFAAFTTVDYADILFDEFADKEKVVEGIIRSVNSGKVVFQNLRSDSQTCKILLESSKFKVEVTNCTDAPYLKYSDLSDGGVDEYIGKERIRVLKKRLRAAKKLGVEYYIDMDITSINTLWFAGQSAELQKRGLLEKNIESNFNDPRLTCFYVDVLDEFHRLKYLSVSYAMCRDRLVAFQVAMKLNRTVYAWITAYNREYGRASPSVNILYNLIKKYQGLGFDTVDLMKGEELYKTKWCTRKIGVCDYSVGLAI
ncbi:MAG: GNAT family N-acetyltransferase [Candidatus Thiodiazotropha taylori]|nr:GNAT family N-acetyltransferase [Candidatus Thiodiazotropha taylori]MCW4223699.1 GNAT family N-acetyltransferase [Candidatus Thiodiazotropha endolucinida]MCG7880930.1 GNAT family N-acetyltransferase [Candidatus Thiodiazotropha taylori]MCG7885276.1 GNAT family N-acetyltransferase [Candidatus Thiodiazotropha taylori]MCG7891917.1 GNAT family N-acetyltransferase [Candidatus Thiodiazotropha taylori]